MDEIRRARLERLGQPTQSRSNPRPKQQAESQPQPQQAVNASPSPSSLPAQSKPAKKRTHLDQIFELESLNLAIESPTFDDLDTIIWEAINTCENKYQYLSECLERVRTLKRLERARTGGHTLQLASVEPMLASYAVVCATSDPQEPCYGDVTTWLLGNANWQFVALMIDAAFQQDLGSEIMDLIWGKFRQALLSAGLKGDYSKILFATDSLLANKQVAQLVAESPLFAIQPQYTPLEIAQKTWLGPYLSLSTLDGAFPMTTFADIEDLSFQNPLAVQRIENTMPETQLIMDRLFSICDKLVRASPQSRQHVLVYFARVLDKNHKRMASFHVSPKDINADGFMANLTYVAVKFCLPFADFTGAKLAKIDPAYFLFENSYDIAEETKLVADLEESKQTLAARSSQPPNFITQIFFIAVGFMHYGLGGLYQSETRLKRTRQHAQGQVDQIQAAVERMGDTPQARMAMKRAKTQASYINSAHLALSAVIRNQTLMTSFYEFGAFIELWTLHQAQPTYPQHSLEFNNNSQASALFRSYPEFFVESYVATFSFIGQALPHIARQTTPSVVIDGLIFYMECPQFIKNPYLKSQMVDVLFYGALPQKTYGGGDIPGYFVDFFNSNVLCKQHLFHALMKIYVDMELTGRSAQFYEKFHTREVISRIMQVLWQNPHYQHRLEQESTHNEEFFVKFTALLLNDSTYMLDEALGKLQEIHRLQQEIENNPNAQQPEQPNEEDENEENQTPQQQLASAEDRAKQYLELSKGCIDLLSTFTSKVPGPFIRPEVVDRFVSMLDYNLNALVGPKCSELKVKTPEKYGFNPRGLLATILRIYLNLASFQEFVQSVARDSESFGTANFTRAANLAEKFVLVTPQEQSRWKSLVENVEVAIQENEDDDEELGEIPEEFLDPLMYTLMKEPVILPSSGTTIDLTTIKSYLLQSPTDPFNRTPLKVEDVIPNVELKQKIEEFKHNARQKK